MKFAACAFALILTATAHAQFSGRRFVIDPGHGGTDPGAVGIDGGADPNEADFVLDMAFRLKARLEAAGGDRRRPVRAEVRERIECQGTFTATIWIAELGRRRLSHGREVARGGHGRRPRTLGGEAYPQSMADPDPESSKP